MKHPAKLVTLLDKLITDGDVLLKQGCWRDRFFIVPDDDGIQRWKNELILFRSLAGGMVAPWKSQLTYNGSNLISSFKEPVAALKTIKYAVDQGLLARYQDLVIAEAFGDLLEQATYLLQEGYFLAAGVILRAVLEERLRKLCEQHGCFPSKDRPTISDLNMALYKAEPPVFEKTMMLHVTSMAAVGNDAAHNAPSLKKEDVERLARDVTQFLAQFAA